MRLRKEPIMSSTARLSLRVAAVFAAAITAAGGAGCAAPPQRLNAPPQGWSSRQAAMQEHYVYMTDNALLAEMDVTDVHFTPHSAALNSLGARRLDRYAALLKESGGELKYDTQLTDAKLVEARLASVREYLTAAGADLTKLTVVRGPAGVDGMSAEEAIAAREKLQAGKTDQEKTGSSGAGTGQGGY